MRPGTAKFMTNILGNAATITIVDPDECIIAQADGLHIPYGPRPRPHAEENALRQLEPQRRSFPAGSQMFVVVRSQPCVTPGHMCWNRLARFAARIPTLVYGPLPPWLVYGRNVRLAAATPPADERERRLVERETEMSDERQAVAATDQSSDVRQVAS